MWSGMQGTSSCIATSWRPYSVELPSITTLTSGSSRHACSSPQAPSTLSLRMDASPSSDVAARAVANSALVKTSWCGGDPNWGRIIDALGYSPAMIIEDKIYLGYSRPGEKKITFALTRGQPTKTPFATLVKLVTEKEFDLHIFLNLGSGHAVIYSCDLTEEYVDFNKGDVSDPSSLGG